VTDTWNAAQYDKFQREREQPFFDLLGMVQPRAAMRIVDLGCGTGRLTRHLHEQLHARETIGIDRSPNMLEAQRSEMPLPGLSFEVASIEDFPGDRGNFDLIFSNAAFHWVEHHDELLKRLRNTLAPSGQLAFQVPASHDELPHHLAEELARTEPYRSAFDGWRHPQPVLTPIDYARTLYRLGFPDPRARLIVYPHVLPEASDAIEWTKGTLLTDYARHLPPELFEQFLADYRTRLLERVEPTRPFFFPFKRILCWAQIG
jgi:trans-aconitate 2-methyltransferase